MRTNGNGTQEAIPGGELPCEESEGRRRGFLRSDGKHLMIKKKVRDRRERAGRLNAPKAYLMKKGKTREILESIKSRMIEPCRLLADTCLLQ